MREAFALQKLLTFFQQKILAYLRYFKTFEILTSTTSLVLNNRALFKKNKQQKLVNMVNNAISFHTREDERLVVLMKFKSISCRSVRTGSSPNFSSPVCVSFMTKFFKGRFLS